MSSHVFYSCFDTAEKYETGLSYLLACGYDHKQGGKSPLPRAEPSKYLNPKMY